ncbi:hypothetical protein HZB94_01110 [Candidatus Falkowbacteria bacterium]|nr:hypothetical protein [Candidatus Falkowbacteria bacterium]
MSFKHSNREKQEMEYARMNREYLEEQRGEVAGEGIEKNQEEDPSTPLRAARDDRKKRINKFCCWLIFIIIALAVFIIYYFVINIKDVVVEDYFKKKGQVEGLLPQGKDEVKKSIEQGESLITETQKSVEDLQGKYQKTKETIEGAQKKYEEVKEIKENIEKMIGQ